MDDVLRKLIALAAKRFDKSSELISTDDDMFETLEIHSLQALELLTDLEEAFGIEIPDYELQDVKTLNALAECIRDRL